MKDSDFINRLLKTKLILPPLSGYTDYSYRKILASFFPPFICTEMISPHAIIHKNPKLIRSLEKISGSHFSGVQLVGNDSEVMAEAAKIIESLGYDYIDINMGCTVNSVTQAGAGLSLMKSEKKASEITSAIINAVNIPVTCKIRLGPNKRNINAITLGKKLVDTGLTAITVHGRTGEKKFGLPINYFYLKEVVESLKIPVIANGNIFNGKDAKEMIEKTKAAAIMPGRGIIGNPWLIPDILFTLSDEFYQKPSLEERKNICLQHTYNLINFFSEKVAVIKMRRILPEYFRFCQNLISLKQDIRNINSLDEVHTLIDRIKSIGSNIIYSF